MPDSPRPAANAEANATATAEAASEALCLLAKLGGLREAMTGLAAERFRSWAPRLHRQEFRASAENLADYLALRRLDLGGLQAPLAALGLSSLVRAEGHVRASVDAVMAALARIAGEAEPPHPAPEVFVSGAALLAARRDALFSERDDGPQTRIMATLPSEAAQDPQVVVDLILAGVDCLRIDCAHDEPSAWRAMASHARTAARSLGRDVVVQMDLAGPKLRLTEVRDKTRSRLHPGDRFVLTDHIGKSEKRPQAVLSHPEVLDRLMPGNEVWINDGLLGAMVVKAEPGRVVLEAVSTRDKGEHLKPERGVNIPGLDLTMPALTGDDLDNLAVVLAEADLVAMSFAQTVEDVEALLAAIARHSGPHHSAHQRTRGAVLKIETPLGLRNLPELIVAAAGRMPVAVMIARGDLAVEIGFDRLSEAQEEILWLCEAAQVPVIWAAQVLEGLVREGQVTRADAADAAMAQRAECVMLGRGPHAVEGVAFLRDVLMRMDRHQMRKSARLAALGLWQVP